MLTIASFLPQSFSIELLLSMVSVAMTAYFWLVKARQERPDLRVYQLRDFRANLRRGNPEKPGTQRLSLAQIDHTGVLVANNSTRQNSIVRYDCFLPLGDDWIKGHWGYLESNSPPWNIPPQSALAFGLVCSFDVPEDFQIPDQLRFRVEFITPSGRRFVHTFSRQAPLD